MSQTEHSILLRKHRSFQRRRLIGTYLLSVPLLLLACVSSLIFAMLGSEYGDIEYWLFAVFSFVVFMALVRWMPKKTAQLKRAIKSLDDQLAEQSGAKKPVHDVE